MKASARWLNDLLVSREATRPLAPLPAHEIDALLTDLGLPSDNVDPVQTRTGPDTCLDVEITSNRGDCMCHRGLARELASRLPDARLRDLPPPPGASGPTLVGALTLSIDSPDNCPRFIARVIRSVKVGPSPDWLAARLEAIGQRPINNIVDITNLVAAELGTPCHAFDADRLAGNTLHVRTARSKERLTTLDGIERTLQGHEVVICDANGPTSLAGVMGGLASSVTERTTNIVLEFATWHPANVRAASRAHQLRTTSSARYERIVDARVLDEASLEAARLILELAGGTLLAGSLDVHGGLAPLTTIVLRPQRVSSLLGIEIDTERIVRCLSGLGIEVGPLGRAAAALQCSVPAWRPDLTREVDLIEEVARVLGYEHVPATDRVRVPVSPAQADELLRRTLAQTLAGLGFNETITFGFATPHAASLFTPTGLVSVVMNDSRRGEEPALRASPLSGLLSARAHNQRAGARQDGGVRLFEIASGYAQTAEPSAHPSQRSVERTLLAFTLDLAGKDIASQREGVRLARGCVEALVRTATGDASNLRVLPLAAGTPAPCPGVEPRSCGVLSIRDGAGRWHDLGWIGLASKEALALFDLATPVALGEIRIDALERAGPPRSRVVLPPAFPGIERDLSLILDERVSWSDIDAGVRQLASPPFEDVRFVGTFRGAQVGEGRKSLTLRLSYRDPQRTLTHEEVDAPVQHLLQRLRERIPFELRA